MYWFDDDIINKQTNFYRYEDTLLDSFLDSNWLSNQEKRLLDALTPDGKTRFAFESDSSQRLLRKEYRNEIKDQKQRDVDAWTEQYGELYFEMFLYLEQHFFPHLNVIVIENEITSGIDGLIIDDRKSKLDRLRIRKGPINFAFDWENPNDWVYFLMPSGDSLTFSNYTQVLAKPNGYLSKEAEADLAFLKPLLDECVSHWNRLKQTHQLEPFGLYQKSV